MFVLKLTRISLTTLVLFTGIIPNVNGQNLFPYRKDSLWGFCDSQKNILIPFIFESASIFSECEISTVKIGGKYRFINNKGEYINQRSYDKWSYFWVNKTYVWQDEKVGLIDSSGREIIPIIYDDIEFTLEIFGLKMGENWAFFDYETGEQRTKFLYQDVFTRSTGLNGAKLNDKWGFVNSKGQVMIKHQFDEIQGFSKLGLCAVKKGEYWGFINLEGKTIVSFEYDEVQNYQSEGAWVKKDEKWGLINAKGDIVIPFVYKNVSYFKEGLAYVNLTKKYGFIDGKGNTVIPFLYDQAFEFSEGMASVCLAKDSCGYINKEGTTVIPFEYSVNFGSEFNEGLAEVKKQDFYGFINKMGEIVVPIEYKSVADYNEFSDGIGALTDPQTDQIFYFDRYGTLFYED